MILDEIRSQRFAAALAALLATAALAACGACGGGAPEVEEISEEAAPEGPRLVVGRIPAENPVKALQAMQPLMKLMGERLGMRIQPASARDYDDFIQKMADGEYDIAFLAPLAYVAARDSTGYEAIARPVRGGSDSYTAIIISRVDGPIRTLADLKGSSFAFADERSTSGSVVPRAYLLRNGIDPARDFRKTGFVGGHDNVVMNVYRGVYDAGACFNDARPRALDGDAEKVAQLRIVATTDTIPNEPIAVSPRLRSENPDLVRKITEFFTTLHETPEGREALRHYSMESTEVTAFAASTDTDYRTVREYAAALERAGAAPTHE